MAIISKVVPRVSVVMPVFNGEDYIGEAIDSILRQTFREFELLIIDDGSHDQTRQIVSSFTDNRVKYSTHESNLGITAARNTGVLLSKGEYVAMIDCDDVAYPTRLQEQVAFLDHHPDFAMVGSWADLIGLNSRFGEHEPLQMLQYDAPQEHIPPILLFGNYFVQSSVMLRKSMISDQPYRDFAPAEDYDLWVRLSRNHSLGMIKKPLVKYRLHSGNVSKLQSQAQDRAVRTIVTNQLNEIGLHPTSDELCSHQALAGENVSFDFARLQKIEKWLIRVLEANQQNQLFDPDLLSQVVRRKWKAACGHVCRKRPTALVWCLSSHLTKGNRSDFIISAVRGLGNWKDH